MRFNEFKLTEQDQKAGFYTIGDSHAVGLANYAGKPWISKARNGTRSTDPMHKAAIATIPKGSTVAISLGANDAQVPGMLQAAIAANVAGVVNAAKQQGLKVHFVLFPVGTKPNREFRAKVREAIKAAVDVPIVDLEGSRLLDGVHADASAYKKAASSIVSASPLGPSSATPGNVPTKDKGQAAQPGSFSLDVPNSRRGPAVADVQKALIALGYPLPKHGVDGIRGPETIAAVKQFQQANNLAVDGDPGPETVAKLNAVLKTKPEIASKLTKSTTADVKTTQKTTDVKTAQKTSDGGDAKGNGDAIEALMFFVSKGWTGTQAAGIVGNLQAESGTNLKIDAVGDGGQAYGIAQWHPPRQANFAKVFGKDIRKSSFKDQLGFVDWELKNTESRAGNMLKSAKTPEEAASIVDQYYERSSGAHRQKRIDYAMALSSKSTKTA